MADPRNVIVFAVGEVRFAVEIRWVKEVVTLGFVTTVPSAPAALCGVCNLHGHIVPVIDVASVFSSPVEVAKTVERAGAPAARQGDGALLIEISGSLLAIRLEKIDRVASYEFDGRVLLDGSSTIVLLDPQEVFRTVAEQVSHMGNSEELSQAAHVHGNESPGSKRLSELAES
jgi:chemotaxis signal transduction protein